MKTMKVAELKAIIRKHNLMYAIRGYSHMNKGSLVDALAKQDRNSFCALSIMVNAHNKSRDELKVMKVAELKALVRKHNLDNAIRQYSKMKKSELVDALMKHSTASGSFSPPLTVTKADGTVKELKKRVKKATVKPAAKKPAPKPAAKKAAPKPAAKKAAPKPKKKVTLVIEKETPKPAPKKAAPKKEEDDDEDDFFANIGKGKGAIKKTTLPASYLASKKALKELRQKDPVAYAAKIDAQSAAQKARGNPMEEFDKKKREAEAAAKKAWAKKPAAPKKKPAAPKPAAAKPVVKGSPEKIIEQYLGDFEKLKRIIFDQRRKVKGEEKEFLSDTVDRLNRIVDKYAPENATVKATVNTGLKQPTLKELGLSGAVPDKDWVKKTRKEVNAFIKANEKTMGQEINKQKAIIREKKIAEKLGETKEKALERERIRDQKRADKAAANEARRKEIAAGK